MTGWQDVWKAIDERRIALGMSKADLYRATNTSERTFQKMADGIPVARDAKRRQITNGLGWTADSIERILDGADPMPEPNTRPYVLTAAETMARLDAAVRRIDALEETVALLVRAQGPVMLQIETGVDDELRAGRASTPTARRSS